MTRSVITLFMAALLSGCAGLHFRYMDEERSDLLRSERGPQYPQATFLVFSDPHYYEPSLWRGSPAFEEYAAYRGKMYAWCEGILIEAARIILSLERDFVIVPGDLTKDGARKSHETMARLLQAIENSGTPVYVIPGNHDILNPDAARCKGDEVIPAENITPEEFVRIHHAFGFDEALFRDEHSLSYVAEPVPGLWLLALDSCIYLDNIDDGHSEGDGAFSQETVDWIEDVLMKAFKQGKAVVAMLHHGTLEHYPGQATYDDPFVVDEYEAISKMLACYNVRMVFTGHYHAQDITMETWPGDEKFIFDIETGSLLTYPCPVRSVRIDKNGNAAVHSFYVEALDGFDEKRQTFPEYARNFIHESARKMVYDKMRQFFAREEASQVMSRQVADAFTAHVRGDEVRPKGEVFGTDGAGFIAWLIDWDRQEYVEGFWTDKPPADNDILIDLRSGAWKPLEPLRRAAPSP